MDFTGIRGIHILLKIQEKKEHLQELQQGKLFFRKLSAFAKMQDDSSGRADKLEGSTHIIGTGPHRMKIETKSGEVFEAEISDVRVGRGDIENWYCFCLYAMSPGEFNDKEIKSFKHYKDHLSIKGKTHSLGSNLIYFTDTQKFIDQIRFKLEEDGLAGRIASVKDVDVQRYSGTRINEEDIGFVKPLTFSHQNELRIIIKNPPWTGDTVKYEVGDLSHLSKITSVNEFNSKIEIGFPDDFSFFDKAKYRLKFLIHDFVLAIRGWFS